MIKNIIKIVNEIDNKFAPLCKCSYTKIHGINHLRQVAYLAGRFAYSINECEETAIIGGYLHDCARENDGNGNSHAHESALLATKIISKFYPEINIERVYNAIFFHADGLITDDPFIGCIWDADRLNLVRIGIIPKVELLSTEVAKRFHSRFIENNRIFSQIKKIALNIQNQINETGKGVIGIWYSENSNIILQFIFNVLEGLFSFDFSQLSIVSLFEYNDTPKNHDQSCCYQIYKSCSNRISLNQIVCPQHDLNQKEKTFKDIPCIISYDYPYNPYFDRTVITFNEINTYPINVITRDYISRFYERYTNTPDSFITLPIDFFYNLNTLIVLIDKSFISNYKKKVNSIIPEPWLLNSFKLNNLIMHY